MFINILFFSTMITISSMSWFGMWIGLEINLLSIIPLMNNLKNPLSSEASMKYFITQALASMILLFSLIFMSLNILNNYMMMLILNSSLLTKIGMPPFHFWFPEVMEGLNWFNCLILLTWQKIAPMIMLMYNYTLSYFYVIIIISMLISGIMGLNQISLRKILTYSSMNHLAWMITSMMFNETLWLYYLLIYIFINFNLIILFMKFNLFYLSQLFQIMNNSINMKIFFMMNFFSLGGLPPFLGFLPKWLTIQLMIENKMFMISTFMVLTTLLTLFFYMRISMSFILFNTNNLNIQPMNMSNKYINFSFNFIILNSMILLTLMFNFT
uniref:NADH-ubiquinone oxidoreductase chain 2 n=1 Tax=Georissidae sp. BMNH 840458 TaxID=1903816 RepID=A0A343A3J2_9COLE|nr:NADH dehydrogenase subunit 2 [Georissidae sp. BMNH 840458]